MNNKEKLTRKVIELIHGKPYDECDEFCHICGGGGLDYNFNDGGDCEACSGTGSQILEV